MSFGYMGAIAAGCEELSFPDCCVQDMTQRSGDDRAKSEPEAGQASSKYAGRYHEIGR